MYKIFINKYLRYFQIQENLSYSENIPNYFQSFHLIQQMQNLLICSIFFDLIK